MPILEMREQDFAYFRNCHAKDRHSNPACRSAAGMFFKNRRLIVVPTSCLLAGAMAVSGIQGCASRRQARTEAPVESLASQSATPVQPLPPQAPLGVEPPPMPVQPARPIDQGPNFLPEPMTKDGNLPTPEGADDKAGASKSRLGQKFAGLLPKRGANAAKKRQATPAAEQPAETPRVNPGDKVAVRSNSLQAREASFQSGKRTSQPVKLSQPVEIYQYSDDRTPTEASSWRMSFPSQSAFRQTSLPSISRSIPAQPASTSMQNEVQWRTTNASSSSTVPSSNDEFGPLPQWPHSTESQPRPVIRPQQQPFQMPRLERAPAHTYQTEPSRMTNPPALRQMPVSSTRVKQAPAEGPLSISRMALCRDVRSFNEYTEIDVGHLQPGQAFLIYAALENFRSISTLNGFQTLTLSSLEVWTRSGQQVARQTLGTATDVSDAPRDQYYLTHAMKVPDNLVEGDYVLQLNVFDLNSRQTSKSFLAVRITGGHNHQGATGGSGELASRPSSSRR
jgi:hypothetical protein